MTFSRIDLDDAAINALLHGPAGPVVRAVEQPTARTANRARLEAPVDKGELRASIGHSVTARPGAVVGRVYATARHGIWQHQGTGVYAGRGPIRPKRAKVLVFRPKGSRQTVFAHQVKGTPPNPFLLRALRAESPWPVRER